MNRICVYCGSRPGNRPDYEQAARAFARELLRRDLGLVYGGGSVGLMGVVADVVVEGGGDAIGVIPEAIREREVDHGGLDQLHVVDSMHDRKAKMVELSDGFVALPGGLGTLEELFEVLTWSQLGFHEAPCGLLDVADFYADVLAHLDRATDAGFVEPAHRDLLLSDDDPAALLDAFEGYEPPAVEKWLDEDET